MANSRCDDFQVNTWNEYCYSNLYHNPIFYSNEGHSNNQLPWFPTHYTPHLAGCDGQGMSLIGARTIGHPGATVSRSSFYAPSQPSDHTDGSSFQPPQQGLVHRRAILQQVTSCDYFSQGTMMISNHLPCDLGPGGSQYAAKVCTSIPGGQCDPQIVPGSTPGYVRSPCIAPLLPADGGSDITFESPGPKTPVNDADRDRRCPICSALLGRSQERNRHILSHLPLWLQCPDPACSWRGSRRDTLKNHRRKNHPSSSQGYDKDDTIIYDPWPLVKEITARTIHIEDAEETANSMVVKRALELGKLGIWGDFWCRKRRKLRRARETAIAEVDPSP